MNSWSKIAVITAVSILLVACSSAPVNAPVSHSQDKATFVFFFTEG